MEGSSETVEDKCIEELLLKSREDNGIDSKSNEEDDDSFGDSDVDFDDDLNEDLESLEGDDEIEEEEGVNDDNVDVENTAVPTKVKDKKTVKSASGKKRKRKRRDNTKRRDIRKILDESQLEKETLHAQLEEKERLRRLELQKSLATEMSPAISKDVSNNSLLTENANEPSRSLSPMVVDFRQKAKQHSHVIVIDSDDDASVGDRKQQEIEIISSDSVCSSSSSESDSDDSDIDENNVGMHSDDSYNVPNPDGKVEVNINHPLYEDDIYLAPQIAKHVKPHQIGGIRFLYDNLVETLARYKVSSGFGCILAHSMGLGKTLQVIAFVDIFLRHTPAKKVLIVVPINTIQNWLVEFNMWLPPKPEDQENKNSESEEGNNEVRHRDFTVYQLSDNNKTTTSRAKIIGEWNQNGGVLLMGYELYRILAMSTPCMASNKCAPPKRKKSNTSSSTAVNQEPEVIDLEEEEKNMDFLIGIQNALCYPGPDLVICDEGHRIKNNQSNISQALKKVKTRRRVVLTGYPLQNNLIEYWCMIDFVRPNFLGTRHEFSNMFERPILNGQCSDSTASDVRLMRYRAHVLHSLLEGFVQRRSQSVLKKCLPFKEEHIILVKLSSIQSQLYDSYINFLLDSVGHLNPIKGFHTCTKIWNHPDVFFASLEPKKYGMRNESPLTLLDNDTEDGGTSQEVISNMDPAMMLSALPRQVLQPDPNTMIKPTPLAWAKDIMKDYQPFIEEQGAKMVILMEIIEESLSLGEKVLVFSQSLSTLSVIEDFLSKRDIPHFPGRNSQNDPTKWAKNKSYFRLDGSTPSQERDRLINAFNSPNNTDVLLFMLSTRAGCLGVNLIGASRVVVFDASWNPCHDVQAVCRVYRYGQKKPSHIYRLVSTGTMEKKIYDRQVSKQGVANRVVDELNPEANFTKQEIMSLICDKEPEDQAENVASAANEFSDLVLKRICKNCSNWLAKVPFKHESLLVDKKELKLTKREKREAKKGYEREKNMAQQGGRYNYNPTDPRRIPLAAQVPSDVIRPVAAARPVQSTQPSVMATVTQRTQSQAFSVNMPQVSMGSNFRFASLNHNVPTNPIQLRALLPNMGISRAANLSLRMPMNPVAMSTNVTNPLASQLMFPSQSAMFTSVNQRSVQAGTNFAANLVSGLHGNLTNGNVGSGMNVGRALPLTIGSSRPRTNEVVTIDLDDVPSPPDGSESQNDTTNKPQEQEDHNNETSSTANEPVSMATELHPFVSMETSAENPPNQANTSTTVASMATEDAVNVGSPGEPVTMVTDAATSDAYTSISELLGNGQQSMAGTESSSTTGFSDPQLTLAVLQNLLNERGGLGASASPPEQSPPDDSSENTSQM